MPRAVIYMDNFAMAAYTGSPAFIPCQCYLVGGLLLPHRGGPLLAAMLITRAGQVLSVRMTRAPAGEIESRFNDLHPSESTYEDFAARRQYWNEVSGGWAVFEKGFEAEPLSVRLLNDIRSYAPEHWDLANAARLRSADDQKEAAREAVEHNDLGAQAAACRLVRGVNPLVFEPFRPPSALVQDLLTEKDHQPELRALLYKGLVAGDDDRIVDELTLIRPESAANFIRYKADEHLEKLLVLLGISRCRTFNERITGLTSYLIEATREHHQGIGPSMSRSYRESGARMQVLLNGIIANCERIRDIGNAGSHGTQVEHRAIDQLKEELSSFEAGVADLVGRLALALGAVPLPDSPA